VNATVAATAADSNGFSDLGLHEGLVQALRDVGYEAPTPIQAATIPPLLAGSDVLGQAQTGTGKTGAFALPILAKIDVSKPHTQAMVLVPTRELAIQVAEAFQRYATHMKGFHVLPIYGGQSYTPQLKGLKRGAHVIVGTPGRVMDHMKRGSLPLDEMSFLVLDEADEMLQMGFIDDIEWILEQSPPKRQVALFSATVPAAIRRIAQRHLREPKEITIRSKTSTAPNIRQRYWLVSGMHKLDALTRILEVETFDAMLVFVRTKLETVELSERLEARGFEAAPLNGDIPQQQRERTIAALKSGKVDIVVATDVAARGLDVERISHVVNYDVPYDSESYIHRIGRTGRAGRSGEAILFIAPRERNMLRIIERATRQQIAQMNLPSVAAVNEQRVAKFKQRIADALAEGEAQAFRGIVEEFQAEHNVSPLDIASALASLVQGSTPLLLPERPEPESRGWSVDDTRGRDRRDDFPPRGRFRDRDDRRPNGAARDDRRGPNAQGDSRDRDNRRPTPARAETSDGANRDGVQQGDAGQHANDGSRERPRGDAPEQGPSRAAHGSGDAAEGEGGARGRDDRRPTQVRAESSDGASHEGGNDAQQGDAGQDANNGSPERSRGDAPARDRDRSRDDRPAHRRGDAAEGEGGARPGRRRSKDGDIAFETFRLEVGHAHGVKPGNIVGAIANEAGLEGKHIGHVDIRDDHTFIDLPEGMPRDIFRSLQKVRVVGQELRISRVDGKAPRQH
jgi:ATP-dependent RNA helicase DeaD